ncbi:MAG: DUF3471 domain-containing protein [bacterium]
MIVQLDSGRITPASGAQPERRLFTTASTRQLWSIVTPIPVGSRVTPGFEHLRANLAGYALEVAVLTNQESGDAFNAITLAAIDALLGAPTLDYLGLYSARRDTARMNLARSARSAATARDSTSGPSLALGKYAARFADAWYGDVDIALEGRGLVMRFSHTPQLVGDMVHWQHDSFLVRWRDRELRADAYATFSLNPDGSIDRLKMAPASDDVDFSFDFQDLLLLPTAKVSAP